MTDHADNWRGMATTVVRAAHLPRGMWEEAVQETALAGWLASERWTSDGGMSRRNWIWQQMERGLIDWLRQRLGRQGNRAAWERSLKYLDEPVIGDGRSLGETLEAADAYTEVEHALELAALITDAGLDTREQRWVDVYLADLPQNVLMAEWDVCEGRVSQIKRNTLTKLRAAA